MKITVVPRVYNQKIVYNYWHYLNVLCARLSSKLPLNTTSNVYLADTALDRTK